MNTEDLIRRLGDDLGPVRRLASPWKRAVAWLVCAAAYVSAVGVIAWARGRSLPGAGADVVQQGALIATAVSSSVAAFASVVPASDRRVLRIPLVAGILVMAALVWDCYADVRMLGTLGVGRETDWPCVISISVGGTLLWALGVAMLHQGAPMTPRVSSLLAGVAAFSVANIEACLSRSHAFAITMVLWHGMTTALLVATFAQLGRLLLTWKKLPLISQ